MTAIKNLLFQLTSVSATIKQILYLPKDRRIDVEQVGCILLLLLLMNFLNLILILKYK